MTLALTVALAMSVSVRAFHDSDSDEKPSTAESKTFAQPATSASTAVVTNNLVGVGVLHLLNEMATATGTIAQARAQSAAVRALGKEVMARHASSQQRLRTWLTDKPSLRLLLSDTAAEGQSDLRLPAQLKRVPASRFDPAFLRALIALATRSLRFVDVARSHVADKALDKMLHDTEGSLHRSRARARELLKDRVGSAPSQESTHGQGDGQS